MLQRRADRRGDILGAIGLQRAVADGADAQLLRQLALVLAEQLDVGEVAVLGLDRPDVAAHFVEVELEGGLVAGVLHHPLHVRVAPAGVNPDLDVVQALHLAVVAVDHELHLLVLRAVGVGHEVQRRLFDLDAAAAGVAEREQLLVHRHGHVPDHLAVVLVLVGVDVEEQAHDLGAAGAEAHRLARLALGDAPDLRVVERAVLDLAGDPRPAPCGVDLVEQRAGRVAQPGASRRLGLQGVALEAGPALQRIVVPAPPGEVLVAVEVAVREDVEAGALLVADHDGERIFELLAEADVEHAGVERLAPHAGVEPARTRP